ncbi:MAG: hypothetical protein J0J12_00810, partial [Bosea sp.]|nr:hypothetical protein [Bosea sp. (in: a-proteobacteria)]
MERLQVLDRYTESPQRSARRSEGEAGVDVRIGKREVCAGDQEDRKAVQNVFPFDPAGEAGFGSEAGECVDLVARARPERNHVARLQNRAAVLDRVKSMAKPISRIMLARERDICRSPINLESVTNICHPAPPIARCDGRIRAAFLYSSTKFIPNLV